jgi:ribosomal protein RSM22 (predicted rRNA methylase)
MSLVQIPESIRNQVADILAGENAATAAQALSVSYRSQSGHAVSLDSAAKRAYLAARMPATYAAAWRALDRMAQAEMPDFESLLDVGCGPGTGSLAAASLWPRLAQVTRSDLDSAWRPTAEALGVASDHAALAQARWLTGAMDTLAFPPHDAVIAVYALNEVPAARRGDAVRNLWRAATRALILVEPGTPQGFLNIQAARNDLLSLGGHVVAPCAHHGTCPMSEQDWCHSAVRLPRDALHRSAKGAQLAFEDEKFAYLAVTRRSAARRPQARIVKRPVAHRGHATLDLCTETGLVRRTVSRRDGELYKASRKAEWGDGWPPD